MKAAKITAKLRDAVPVCLYANGEEQVRYKNIELPDSIKALEVYDFGFDIDAAGWISFRLHFDDGVLPEKMPEPRPPVTREQKRAAKSETVVDTADLAAAAAEVIEAAGGEITETPAPGEDYTIATAEGNIIAEIHHGELPSIETSTVETSFNVTGARRKELVAAIAEVIGQQAEYLGAPSFAYAIGHLRLDKTGTLHGEPPFGLLTALAQQNFIPATTA